MNLIVSDERDATRGEWPGDFEAPWCLIRLVRR
jgi:hypothetical protein